MEAEGYRRSPYPFLLERETLADTQQMHFCYQCVTFILNGFILARNKYYVICYSSRIKWKLVEVVMKIIMYRCPKCNRVKQFSTWKHLTREELVRLNYVEVEFRFVQCDMC
jgi:hypothetical protein